MQIRILLQYSEIADPLIEIYNAFLSYLPNILSWTIRAYSSTDQNSMLLKHFNAFMSTISKYPNSNNLFVPNIYGKVQKCMSFCFITKQKNGSFNTRKPWCNANKIRMSKNVSGLELKMSWEHWRLKTNTKIGHEKFGRACYTEPWKCNWLYSLSCEFCTSLE